VRGRIVASDGSVATAAGDLVFDHDHSAYRNLAFTLASQAEGFTEELFVSGGNASPP
jgi:hypothetical protein